MNKHSIGIGKSTKMNIFIKAAFCAAACLAGVFGAYADDWPVVRRFDGEHLLRVALPMGGIGCGSVSLSGRGELVDWEIMNRANKTVSGSERVPAGRTFFAIRVKGASHRSTTMLAGPLHPTELYAAEGNCAPQSCLPRFRTASFEGVFPFGTVRLSDRDLPVEVDIKGFSPFVPGDSADSSLPVASLEYEVRNVSDEPLEVSVAAFVRNIVGNDGNPTGFTARRLCRTGGEKDNRTVYRSGAGLRGITCLSDGVATNSTAWGTFALVTPDADARLTYRESFAPDEWCATLLDFWDDLSDDGAFTVRPPGRGEPHGALCLKKTVPARGKASYRWAFTWNFPNRPAWEDTATVVGNWYSRNYADAWDAAEKIVPRLGELEEKTLAFTRRILALDAPAVIKEAALSNLSVLKSQTVFRVPTGHLMGWEGVFDHEGSCRGSCTHVWNYENAVACLFPDLSRSMRDVEFNYAMDPDTGAMAFRCALPLGAKSVDAVAADGQMGCIMKVYRDWRICRDDRWLAGIWPKVRKALEFAWLPAGKRTWNAGWCKGGWDAGKSGLMDGEQHNTMDVDYYGPNPQMGFWYLGALRAAEEMAKAVKDDAFAKECREIYEKGTKRIDAELFNGDYYEQKITEGHGELKYQLGTCCLVDQLVGQQMAHLWDLGDLAKKENLRKTCASIMRWNFLPDFSRHFNNMRTYCAGDEAGLLMGSWPRGRLKKPFPYFGEVMTGFEYVAAAEMIFQGMDDDALKVIKAVRDRHDGLKRNPFSEPECGHNYARSMASWNCLFAWVKMHGGDVGNLIWGAGNAAASRTAADFRNPAREHAPQTWFHMIGGNVSREGLTADLEAIAGAGIGGIQFFHGKGGVWPRTKEQIQCLSEKWDDLVRFTADECRRLNLVFDMQNCPGWSMCGGPWITHDKAMRRLVCFEPGKKPNFGADDDYREIGTVEFPAPAGFGEPDHKPVSVTGEGDERVYDFGKPVTVRSMTLPNHNAMGLHNWSYRPDVTFIFSADTGTGWKTVFARELPRAAWQDDQRLTFAVPETTAAKWKLAVRSRHAIRFPKAEFSPVARLDHWQALAGWCFRDFKAPGSLPVFGADAAAKKVKLVFGHVNMKKKNGPAPAEATGWECDKLDPLGANAMFDAYVGRLAKGPLKGGLLNGLLLDSWECCCQNWTWKMEEHFRRMNGYELRPYLPVVFGYPAADAEKNAKFLRDWRRTLCRLVEENFYGTMAKRGRELGLKVYFETAFSDVVPGDPLRYWKYADVPMCEFWQPHDNRRGFVGSDDFKPVRSCVSAAHVYGKTRVAAEALTSYPLSWDDNFQLFKDVVDRHLFRGITHLVFHTYTHNPHTGKDFLPPGSSFGRSIGSPFLRGQTWWKFMPQLTAYFARCGYMLERGKPVVDVLWMIGDDHPYRPGENAPFPAGYKYDYCNADALVTRADTRDGRIVFPDGMSYTALWIPEGTFLLPETAAKIDALAKKGAKIIRGELKIDWPSQLDKLGFRPADWYQRRDGNEDIFFVRMPNGDTAFVTVADGKKTVLDPVTGETRAAWRDGLANRQGMRPLALKPAAQYPQWATERTYTGTVTCAEPVAPAKPCVLSLGKVRDWAEVYVNGRKASTLWCAPYVCDLAPFLKKGANEIKVVVTSTWFNRLVRDAGLPENERTTWTICGPKKDEKMRDCGLIGPVTLDNRK